MFVSRKNLAFIHFISTEVLSGTDMAQVLHQGVELLNVSRLCGKLLQPFPERGIKSLALGMGHRARLLDQIFICTQSYVLHTKIVYTLMVLPASSPAGAHRLQRCSAALTFCCTPSLGVPPRTHGCDAPHFGPASGEDRIPSSLIT